MSVGLNSLLGAVGGAAQGALTDATIEQLKQMAADGTLHSLPELIRTDPSRAVEAMESLEQIDVVGNIVTFLPDVIEVMRKGN